MHWEIMNKQLGSKTTNRVLSMASKGTGEKRFLKFVSHPNKAYEKCIDISAKKIKLKINIIK